MNYAARGNYNIYQKTIRTSVREEIEFELIDIDLFFLFLAEN